MSQRGETNRLVYEADLLLRIDAAPDDALAARTRALEDGAALLLEQALVSAASHRSVRQVFCLHQ